MVRFLFFDFDVCCMDVSDGQSRREREGKK